MFSCGAFTANKPPIGLSHLQCLSPRLYENKSPIFSQDVSIFFALDKSHRSQDVCFPCGDRVDNTAHRQTYAYMELAPLAIKLASRTLREKHKSFRSLNIKYIPPKKLFVFLR